MFSNVQHYIIKSITRPISIIVALIVVIFSSGFGQVCHLLADHVLDWTAVQIITRSLVMSHQRCLSVLVKDSAVTLGLFLTFFIL